MYILASMSANDMTFQTSIAALMRTAPKYLCALFALNNLKKKKNAMNDEP